MVKKSILPNRKNLSTKLILFFLLSFFFINISFAQTYVSGGIYSNTIWTKANSPYIVTDTVVVFPNVTLTIQPGVVVKFDDTTYIEVRGSLHANGTSNDSIIFTSNSLTPSAGIYQGIELECDTASFRFCRFSFANNAIIANIGLPPEPPIAHCLFLSNLNSLTQLPGLFIDTCTFKYDSLAIDQSGQQITGCLFTHNGTAISASSNCPISNCIFKNNAYGVQGFGGSTITSCIFDSNTGDAIYTVSDIISNCIIQYNNVGINSENDIISLNNISNNYIGIESYYDQVISCNTICSNTHYNIIAESPNNELASNNYWCLPDSAHIQATIYDAYQNINFGFIYFTPFDVSPCKFICNLSVSATASQLAVCKGDTTTLQANVTDTNHTYTAVWKPGNYQGLSVTVSPKANITYTVIVTDSNGFKDSAFVTIDTVNCNYNPCSSLISAVNFKQTTVCLGDSTTLIVGIFNHDTSCTVVWNPGNHHGTFYTVTPLTDITYTVVVIDTSGCKDSAFVIVDTTLCTPPPCGGVFPPSICYVTADTSSKFNSIIWGKTGLDTLAIDSVVIYRQNVLDQYVRIGEVSVHAHTIYNDATAQPLNSPYFYALGVIDTCGIDTIMSNVNETVFLQSSIGVGNNAVNLNWNFYQGNPVIYYRILRDDSGLGNWHAIDSIQGSINAFTDRNAPINPSLRYIINTDWNVACSPFLHSPHHGSHYQFNTGNEAYSNMTYVFPAAGATTFENNLINIYPNPFTSILYISFSQPFSGLVTITDVLGQEVYSNSSFTSMGDKGELDLSTLRSGVYIITLQSGDLLVRRKIVKN